MNKILNKIAQLIGRDNYSLDKNFKLLDLVELSLIKSVELIRFLFIRMRLKKSGFINFFSSKIKIFYGRNLSIGSGVFIGRGVIINALCKSGIIIGNNVTIKTNSIIDCSGVYSELGEGLVIGNNVGISENVFIQIRGNVIIEEDVIMGPGVKIFSENHKFEDSNIPIRKQGTSRKGVLIEKGCWIGAAAIILDGVTIGQSSVVSAGAVVTKNVPANSLVGGIPAKVIRDIS